MNEGIRLEDRENQPAALKFVDREILLKEKEDKRLAEEAKRKEKERKKAELAAKEAEKEAKRRIPPTEMFKSILSFLFPALKTFLEDSLNYFSLNIVFKFLNIFKDSSLFGILYLYKIILLNFFILLFFLFYYLLNYQIV